MQSGAGSFAKGCRGFAYRWRGTRDSRRALDHLLPVL